MDNTKTEKLFTLFSTEIVTDELRPIIELAQLEIEKMLLPDADTDDQRLDFLCAAIANYRLQQAQSASDRSEYTYAGKMADSAKNSVLNFAEKLVRDYMELCSDLVDRKNFIFMSIPSGEVR